MKYKYKYKVNKRFFDTWSREMAWVLGYIYADGCIVENPALYLTFHCLDREILEKINKALASNHPIRARLTYLTKKRELKKPYVLNIYNNYLITRLIELGVFPRKSNVIVFPSMPKGYVKHFIRGYFDGDGCVEDHRNKGKVDSKSKPLARFSSGSHRFLVQLQRKLLSLKIPTRVRRDKNAFVARVSPRIWKWLYKAKGEWYLERKYLRVKELRGFSKIRGRNLAF